jgi:hypothetical protein
MALDELLSTLDSVDYKPRTLQLDFPTNLTKDLSVDARAFLHTAHDKEGFTVLDLTSDSWKDDPVALDFFFSRDEDVRVEILTFLTLFVHEYTHRVDFLISPFGLQYYANSLREYWLCQEFFPDILDDPNTVEHVRFLAGLTESLPQSSFERGNFAEGWERLEDIIHTFYAWGDASAIKPLGKYIQEGWGESIKGPGDPFGVGISLEPVTVLKFFHTFRVPGADKFWYLRPLTIFETKAVVNSLLFILHLLGQRGVEACLSYYEKVYLQRKAKLPQDCFFLLDLGARLYNHNDFHTLLKQGHYEMLRSTLGILSTVCWYALQAPPSLKEEDSRVANPILRLWVSFTYMLALVQGRLQMPFNSTAEALLLLDEWEHAKSFHQKPIKDIVLDCRRVIDNMIELNRKHTWNPGIRRHFNHVFELMRPHFTERDLSYVSFMGMPEHGNPLFGCRTDKDWEVIYDDYKVPEAVNDWFSIRTDLFFKLWKPTADVIERLDAHYQAFLIPYNCECGGLTTQWASRHAREFRIRCAFCGQTKTWRREDLKIINFSSET